MHHLLTINLGGNINHVINGVGEKAPFRVVEYP